MDDKKNDVSQYLESVIAGGIEYFDYRKLDQSAWNEYRNDALSIAGNQTFNNELSFLISTIIKNTFFEAKNFDELQHARTSVLVLKSFKENLENIEDPSKNKRNEDPHSAI